MIKRRGHNIFKNSYIFRKDIFISEKCVYFQKSVLDSVKNETNSTFKGDGYIRYMLCHWDTLITCMGTSVWFVFLAILQRRSSFMSSC